MKPYVLLVLLPTLALSLSGQAQSRPVIRPEIQVIQNLFFGGLLVSPAGGSITLTDGGLLIPDGSGIQPGAQPPCDPARFRLTGPPGARYSLKVDPRMPMLTSPTGGSARVTQFQPAMEIQGVFDALGQAEFKLGGHLEVAANTPPGLYRTTQAKLQLNVLGVTGLPTVNAPFTLSALVRAPFRLVNLSPLRFGGLLPGAQSGTFEVLASGGYRAPGTAGPALLKGDPSPAQFSLQGPPGSSYSIQLPSQIQLTGPGTPMRVDGFQASVALVGMLPPGGLTFGVGGRLTVDAHQRLGEYRGTFTVTVCYP